MAYGFAALYSGQISRLDAARALAERASMLPHLHRRIVRSGCRGTRFFWTRERRLDLADHIAETTLPAPGSEAQLARLGCRYMATPLPGARPPWQVLLVHGLADGQTAILWKFHHALVDGNAGLATVTHLHSDGSWPSPVGASFSHDRRSPQCYSARYGVRYGALDALRTAAQPPRPSPLNAPLSGRWSAGWMALKLDEIAAVRRAVGGTVNDVVLTVIAGGLGRYLRSRGYRETELRALCPVSVRPDSRPDGNYLSMLLVPLYIGIDHPVERLLATHAATARCKRAGHAGHFDTLAGLLDVLPQGGLLAAGAVRQAVALLGRNPYVHTVVTNVRGQRAPLTLCDHALHRLYLLAPPALGVGLVNSVMSYGPWLTLSGLVDADLVPDPELYIDCVQQSFAELQYQARRH